MFLTPGCVDIADCVKIRVLLVDDNEAFLRAATEFLRRQSELVVLDAICGDAEVVRQAQELEPDIILIGLDVSGLKIITRLREVLPDVGIVALTLLEGRGCRQATLNAGADDLVSKAELATDLLPAIRRVMRNK